MYKFTEQDTMWLQMESVIKCANSLGYEFNGRSFYTYKRIPILVKATTHTKYMYKQYFLSFDDMQTIHNQGFYFDTTCGIKAKGTFLTRGSYGFNRIVYKTYLQYNKKLKCFQTTKNMVKFV